MAKKSGQSSPILIKKQDLNHVSVRVLSLSAWQKKRRGLTAGLIHQDKRLKRPRYKLEDF